jgi:hypothetical protein
VRGFDGVLLRFDGVSIAQNDFFYTFNTALTRRPLARRSRAPGYHLFFVQIESGLQTML